MSVKALAAWMLLAALLFPTSCAEGRTAGAAAFVRVDNPRNIPGLVEWASGALGRNFVLERLPKGKDTLHAGFLYLATESEADLIREALAEAGTVYAAEFEFDDRNKPSKRMRILLYSPNRDFTGTLVHAIFGAEGHHWGVYLDSRESRP